MPTLAYRPIRHGPFLLHSLPRTTGVTLVYVVRTIQIRKSIRPFPETVLIVALLGVLGSTVTLITIITGTCQS